METDRKWIVIRIDGKLAGISRDYDRLADISARIAEEYRLRDASGKKRKTIKDEPLPYLDIQAAAMDFGQVLKLRQESRWEDLMLFGTDFQKRVWKKLWELLTGSTDENSSGSTKNKLLSYTDFAELCDNRAGVYKLRDSISVVYDLRSI